MKSSLPTMLLAAALAALALVSCGSGGDDAPQAVEGYIHALVAKDGDAMLNLSCADWEAGALTELQSFDAVAVRLEGLSCQASGSQGDATVIACQGTIFASYQGEDRPLSLSAKDYLAKQEGGEWRMCGYR
ncbi:MAG: hypothetical protein OEZ02_01930 [Anaerolineae bacterium]|nr:hypothetical protein [Anaerolineae bacterium]